VNFEEYLLSKKIDSKAFAEAESLLWSAWKSEFEQMHPNSFTVQKLNLINPIRRKYPLPLQEILNKTEEVPASPASPPSSISPVVPKPGKPIMKPKPKIS
jgi:hypothetical protein